MKRLSSPASRGSIGVATTPILPRSRPRLALTLWIAVSCGQTVALSAPGPGRYLDRPEAWFAGREAATVAEHILSHQAPSGGWPKNVNTAAAPFAGDRDQLRGTFDNDATTDELRFLARRVQAADDPRCREAFLRGFDHLIEAQYPNGGWPQSHPPGAGYARHITFNDGAMVRLLEFLRETWTTPTYAFLNAERRAQARAAFDRGIECILKCQIRRGGRPTVWCAQHDAVDFQPRAARAYELPSFSGAESAGITRLLMSLPHPSPDVVRAVEGAVAWFQSARLSGIREIRQDAPGTARGWNKVVVDDPAAPPIWARFYHLDTQRPMFVDRDGVPRGRLDQIGEERRNGYAWHGTWPQRILEQEYPAWKRRVAAPGVSP